MDVDEDELEVINDKRLKAYQQKKTEKQQRKKFKRTHGKTPEDYEIEELEKRIQQDAPPRGTNPLAFALEDKKSEDASQKKTEHEVYYPAAKKFEDLPISKNSIKALTKAKYTNMTDIQRAALPHALCGRDVLGAAKTGSGKTLAFLLPILEKLFRLKWNKMDGVGALIISPTRELAMQTFEVLRNVGWTHSFSAGLVIGGKDLKHEKERINHMNIIICTPGRLLQHMDETTGFDCSNLQTLVLDEADRILDMGFEKTLNAILDNLPKNRQTLLFSATQTKSVRDLARLSLKDAEYIGVHEKSEITTPQKLVQHAIFVELNEKIDTLYSFIKTHLHAKIIVFLSSCKQVRFIFESIRRLRPGIQLMAIHGKQKQGKRMATFFEFCRKKSALLFATDVAARGLDFPAVDWVLQVDCPESVQTYIHRVGRTARYESNGNALLFLLPSEEKMVQILQENKIPVKVIKVNPNQKKISIASRLEGFIAAEPELKYLAQKAFISYMRSVFLMPNKEIFDISKLPAADYATSMGLPSTPRIRFTKTKKTDKNIVKQHLDSKLEKVKEDDDVDKKPEPVVSKTEKLFKRKNQDVLSDAFNKLRETKDEDNDDLLVPKRIDHDIDFDEDELYEVEKHAKPRKSKFDSKPILPTKPKIHMKLDEGEVDEDDIDIENAVDILEEDSSSEEEDYDDEDEPEETVKKSAKRKAVLDDSDEDDSEEEKEELEQKRMKLQQQRPQPPRKQVLPNKPMSIADQEQLALKILQRRT